MCWAAIAAGYEDQSRLVKKGQEDLINRWAERDDKVKLQDTSWQVKLWPKIQETE